MRDKKDKRRIFKKDKRSPSALNEQVSNVMRSNKAKNTKPELKLRKLFWKNGVRGYRLHPKRIPGKPDICFTTKKIAIFVNGCFWHSCPHCNLPIPSHNTEFWKKKFENNKVRDRKKTEELLAMQWTPIVIWECEIKKGNIQPIIDFIKEIKLWI